MLAKLHISVNGISWKPINYSNLYKDICILINIQIEIKYYDYLLNTIIINPRIFSKKLL